MNGCSQLVNFLGCGEQTEFSSVSLTLLGDRKAIYPQKFSSGTSEGRKLMGNWLTQAQLENDRRNGGGVGGKMTLKSLNMTANVAIQDDTCHFLIVI